MYVYVLLGCVEFVYSCVKCCRFAQIVCNGVVKLFADMCRALYSCVDLLWSCVEWCRFVNVYGHNKITVAKVALVFVCLQLKVEFCFHLFGAKLCFIKLWKNSFKALSVFRKGLKDVSGVVDWTQICIVLYSCA